MRSKYGIEFLRLTKIISYLTIIKIHLFSLRHYKLTLIALVMVVHRMQSDRNLETIAKPLRVKINKHDNKKVLSIMAA